MIEVATLGSRGVSRAKVDVLERRHRRAGGVAIVLTQVTVVASRRGTR